MTEDQPTRTVWARRFRSWMWGRTDARNGKWTISGLHVCFSLVVYKHGVSLVFGRRDYSLFWAEPKKEGVS